MKLKLMREQREKAGNRILQLRDVLKKENRSEFNTEERAEWDKVNKEFDDLTRAIEIEQRGDKIAEALSGKGKGDDFKPGLEDILPGRKRRRGLDPDAYERAQTIAMHAWLLRQMGKPLSDRHVRACKAVGLDPRVRNFDVVLPRRPAVESRAQSAGTNSEGGYTVPTGFVHNLEKALKLYAAVRNVAEVIRTPDGAPLPWPTINDTSHTGSLLAENAQVSEDAAVFGSKTYGAYKFTSGLVLVSAELDADSAFDMTKTLADLLGERIGRGQNSYFTTGTGSSQPAGIVTGSTLGKTAASATAITANELIDLYHSVDPAYRDLPGVGFMMHDNIAAAVRKLVDSSGRYLWDMDTLRNGQPPLLLGKPVTINQNMQSTIATGTKTVLFGALDKMKIRDAGKLRIRRLEERYADFDQVGFIAFMRSDSAVLNAGTNPIKHLIQA